MTSLLKKVVVSTLVGATICVTALFVYPKVKAAIASNKIQDKVTVQEPTPLEKWIGELSIKESGGRADIRILDVNGYYSYGCLQFQLATFKGYSQKYSLYNGYTDDQYRTEMFNCDSEKSLAKLMIEDSYSNWKHWYNSVTKGTSLGLPPVELSSE